MVADRGGAGHLARPARRDRAGVEVGGAVGHACAAGRRASARASFSLRTRALRALHHVGRPVAGVGELAARGRCRRPAWSRRRPSFGKLPVVHPVQHHLGDRDLPLERLAARLEVDRLAPGTATARRRRRAAARRAPRVEPTGSSSAAAVADVALASGADVPGSTLRLATVTASSRTRARGRIAWCSAVTRAAALPARPAPARSPGRTRRRPALGRAAGTAQHSAARAHENSGRRECPAAESGSGSSVAHRSRRRRFARQIVLRSQLPSTALGSASSPPE